MTVPHSSYRLLFYVDGSGAHDFPLHSLSADSSAPVLLSLFREQEKERGPSYSARLCGFLERADTLLRLYIGSHLDRIQHLQSRSALKCLLIQLAVGPSLG